VRTFGGALLWLAVLLCLPVRSARALDPNKTLTQYAHRIWGEEEGLLQPTIYSILQTRDGFLWLGTQDSLVRFDGIHFRELDNASDAGLSRSLVRALLEDSAGNLWAASVGSGVVRIRPDGSFRRFTLRDGLPSNDAFCLSSGSAGEIWICTTRGLVRLDAAGRMRVFATADGLPSNAVRQSCESPGGVRWVAGLDFGLSSWNGTRFERYLDSNIGSREIVTALACGKDGTVWAGTSSGVVQITPNSSRRWTVRDGLPDNEISALEAGADGSLWIGGNDGISRYRNGEISVYRTRDGLSHSLVLSLFTDREGSLWAGTKDGLDQFTDGKVTPYTTNEGMLSNDAGPVLEDTQGRLWIGTLGHGLNSFDGRHFRALTKKDGLLDDTILALQLDRAGDLWVGSNRGLNRLRNGKVVAAYTRREGLSGASVRALAVDAENVLWVGTDGGLDRFEDGRFVKSNFHPRSPIVALTGGRAVRLFISGIDSGFTYVKGNQAKTYSLDVTHVVDCYYVEPERHQAWMGTLGSGLLLWKNGVVTHIRVRDGLYDNRIYSILRDDRANFWLASSKGIFRVGEKELQDFVDGKARYLTSIPFTTGQLHFECRSGVQPAAWRTGDGRLWFSTTSGLVVVDPNHLMNNSIAPPVQITSVVVNGNRVAPRVGLQLKPQERNLEVRYAGLSFISPEKMTFRYMLDGYDRNWTDAGSRREAIFTNLPPGNFRFRVMGRNADGVWSGENASLSFGVEPRLYQRRWFFPLLALLAAGLIAAGYRMRIRRLQHGFDLVLAERSRIARELHDTLLQGFAGITMQLQALWTRLPLSKEKTFLSEIIKDAAHCSTEARQSLWGLRTTTSVSPDFAGKLANLARDTTAQSSVELSLRLDPVSLENRPEAEYQLLRIAQEAISNSLRHARAGKIDVLLTAAGKRAELSIHDDGEGFDVSRQQFGHFGMAGMRERAGEIGARLTIESAPGRGSTVCVSFSLPQQEKVLERQTG
jgi:ligand-binding sensor domain-containing protein/signal transduction histidine kinase